MNLTIEKVASISNLEAAWSRVKKKGSAGGVDGVTVASFEKDAQENIRQLSGDMLTGRYVPEPLQHIQKDKQGKNEKRALGLPSIKDKIVQTSLSFLFVEFYDSGFSNCSYAYRPGKGTIKAISRVRDFLTRKNCWVSPIDIDNFFDTINHQKCLDIISEKVADPGIIRIVKLYLSSGILKYNRWEDTYDGIPQGGVLSPILSNLYLNEFDLFLHGRKVNFVRYADDIVILSQTRDHLLKEVNQAGNFLKEKLFLRLNTSDEPVINVSRGFSFLGIFFHHGSIKIDYKRVDAKIDKMKSYMKNHRSLYAVVKKVNEFFTGVNRYYARLLPKSFQLDNLENSILNELSGFIARGKKEGFVETKKECKAVLASLQFIRQKSRSQTEILINKVIEDGFVRYEQELDRNVQKDSGQSVQSAIGKKRQEYARKIASETELVVSKFGHFIGYTQQKFTVKHKGVVVASVPKNRLKRVIISSPGVSLSSNLIHQCCKRNISIEFLSGRGEPFAMIYTPQFALTKASAIQMSARENKSGIYLACQFLKGKAKNQINLLKYFNKYLKKVEEDAGSIIEANIKEMEGLCKKLTTPSDELPRETMRNRLMGLEGSISQYYWRSVRAILPPDIQFEKRETYGAKDLFNSLLNYGYGILYNRVQQALADAGAALYISFLHEPQGKKPTLVFDQIEEFRQFVVDRTIVAICNRQEPINTDNKGMLTANTRLLIVKNVQERLGSYIAWRGKRWKCEDIIFHQARLLMHHVRGEKKYRPFIGRY